MEEWKDIPGCEGYYEVSSFGRVRSKERVITYKNGKSVTRKSRIKTPTITKGSYPRVGLQKGGKLVMKFVHRLVAETFIPNPDNLPIVNHKDEDKTNPAVENLEWCNNSYNTSYSNKGVDRRSTKKGYNSGLVIKLSLSGVEVARYNGLTEACEKNNYTRGTLDKVIDSPISRIHDNYIWVYLA